MMAIGCIQAQRCHTNHCPTGVATQHPWLVRGVDPTLKAARLANYIVTLRKDVLALSRACGVPHPSLITADQLELLDDRFGAKTVAELFGYGRGFGLPSTDGLRGSAPPHEGAACSRRCSRLTVATARRLTHYRRPESLAAAARQYMFEHRHPAPRRFLALRTTVRLAPRHRGERRPGFTAGIPSGRQSTHRRSALPRAAGRQAFGRRCMRSARCRGTGFARMHVAGRRRLPSAVA